MRPILFCIFLCLTSIDVWAQGVPFNGRLNSLISSEAFFRAKVSSQVLGTHTSGFTALNSANRLSAFYPAFQSHYFDTLFARAITDSLYYHYFSGSDFNQTHLSNLLYATDFSVLHAAHSNLEWSIVDSVTKIPPYYAGLLEKAYNLYYYHGLGYLSNPEYFNPEVHTVHLQNISNESYSYIFSLLEVQSFFDDFQRELELHNGQGLRTPLLMPKPYSLYQLHKQGYFDPIYRLFSQEEYASVLGILAEVTRDPIPYLITEGDITGRQTVCPEDDEKRWTYQIAYDENGVPFSEAITYLDALDRPIQEQWKVFSRAQVMASEGLYSQGGLEVASSLPAPVNAQNLCYKSNFIKNLQGLKYSFQDFYLKPTPGNPSGEVNNPKPVLNTEPGTLGWFYGPANQLSSNIPSKEPFIDQTQFPYSSSYPYHLGSMASKSSFPSDAQRMGTNKEVFSIQVNGQGELDFLFGTNASPYLGYNTLSNNVPVSHPFAYQNALKRIQKDADGKYSIQYIDEKGSLIAGCFSGIGTSTCTTQLKSKNVIKLESLNQSGSTRIHLPPSKKNTLVVYLPQKYAIGTSFQPLIGFVEIFDILNNRILAANEYSSSFNSSTRALSFDFPPQSTNIPEFIEVRFRYNPLYLTHCQDLHPLFFDYEILVENGLDYSQWTINHFDLTGRLISTVSPKGIDCNYAPNYTLTEITNDALSISKTGPNVFSIAPSGVNVQTQPHSHLGMYGNYVFSMKTPQFNNHLPPPPPCNPCVADAYFPYVGTNSPRGQGFFITNSMNQFLVYNRQFDASSSSYPFVVYDPEEGFNLGLPTYGIVPSDTMKFSVQLNQLKMDSLVNTAHNQIEHIDFGEMALETRMPLVQDFPGLPIDIPLPSGTAKANFPGPNWTSRSYAIVANMNVIFKNGLLQTKTVPLSFQIPVWVYWQNNVFKAASWLGAIDAKTIFLNSFSDDIIATNIEVNVESNSHKFLYTDDKLDAIVIPNPLGGPNISLEEYMLSMMSFEFFKGKTTWLPNHVPNHKMKETIAYDALDRPVKSTSPDAGEHRSVFNTLGELKLSQNAQQSSEGKFSYLLHDALGRITEAGVFKGSGANSLFDQFYDRDLLYSPTSTTSWRNKNKDLDNLSRLHLGVGIFEEVATSLYDLPASDIPLVHGVSFVQRNLGGKLSRTGSDNGYKSWYSYDGFDRLEWVVILIPQIGPKTIHYKYDLLGNLIEQDVNRHKADERFVHHYTYDADKQLANVETSCNGISRVQEARYKYYLTGALKRTELAGNLQGIDYVYNINGALKAVNHPELDPGKDPGRDGVSGSGFLPDYFGYVIDYHDQDYNRPFADFKSGAHPASTNSYSGLPRSTRWKTLTNVGISAMQSMYKYDFDDLGQLKEARLGTYTNSTSVYAPVAQPHDEFGINYDPNGNITGLKRTASGTQIHNLAYNYTPETNKLATVTNSSTAFRTYSYYANGQVSSYIEHGNPSTAYYLKYDDAGHVLEICKAANFTLPVVRFEYNDLGHRVAKHSYHATTYQLTQSTFYLRDPSGRLLSVYQKAPGLPAQERERYLYGMDMIGVMQMDISGQPPELEQPCEECPPPPPPLSIGLGCNGQRMYYLKDQVGNVRVILLRGTTAGTPPLAFQNYYPFGMKQPGGLSSSFTQRFGYQGEYAEQDPETKLAAFEARMYDAVTGRWLAVDPQHQYHSPYLAMGNNPVMMVDPDGELVHLVVGAVIGGVVNWAVNGARFDEKGLAYFGIGALAGALSAGIGAGVNVAIAGGSFGAGFLGTATGVASTGFFAGAATGAATGFTNGLITGTGNSLMDKNSVPYSLEKGLTNGAIQGLVGGVVGGIGGGIDAYRKDLNFWNGTAELDLTQGIGAHGITTDKERIIGKYVGKFEGVDVYETPELGTGYGSGGITLPGRGITVGKGVYTKNLDFELMQHEFGHTLQIKQMGAARFLKEVGLPSLRSASKHGVNGWKHNEFWTEVSANRLSKAYFDSNYQYLSQPWNHIRFPLIYK